MNEQIKKSEFRCETRHRMTRRCEGWNYCSRAIYMITLVQEDRRRPHLGRLAIEDEASSSEAVAARVEPNELGAATINYHGATFAEIDSLAREAVRPKACVFGTEQG